jgi:tellurite resistance protein TerC
VAAVWVGFIVLVLALIAVDLWLTGRRHDAMGLKSAIRWSVFWVLLSVAFGIGVWWFADSELAAQFFTAYLLEKMLSVDNLFVFMIVFTRFRVPDELRHKVLTWGILGALIMRAIMILAGIRLLEMWKPIIYVFGGFLIFTGVRTFFKKAETPDEDVEKTRLVRALERVLPFEHRYDGDRFFTHSNGRRVGTLLLLVLLVIEGTDVVFAVDSIPAVLAVSSDPFIVFSSNILAILGLRALFLTLASLLDKLVYLHYGLGIILVVIGVKMCVSEVVHIPALISFAVTAGILAITVVASVLHGKQRKPVDA